MSPILKTAPGLAGKLPARDAESAKVAFAASPVQKFIIDGTEWKLQQPSIHDRQKAYYSGKKKAHTDKNKLMSTTARTVMYLSPSVTGKTHDKAQFPPTYVSLQDASFQGYASLDVIALQPKKKPRGKEMGLTDVWMNHLISQGQIIAKHVVAG